MKILYNLLFLLVVVKLDAQNGLEGIIVEKYYVSDLNDTSVNSDGGELPVNSVTYRVFVDMQPGYIFQAAFGVPEHEMKIATTTRFFNNEDRGARFPEYSRSQAQNNTVMLDSWLSVGAGMRDHAGVLKSSDDGTNTIVNADGVLLNVHGQAGIPLTEEDGVLLASTEPVTVVGFFDTDLSVLDDTNDGPSPSVISTYDGAWSSLNGSMGPDSTDNIVLIGQFTTDGVFEFELNLQIRNQQTLGVETYVARNASGEEILFEDLIYRDSLDIESGTYDRIDVNDQVMIFPNPASDKIDIVIQSDIELTGQDNHFVLTTLDGIRVMKGKLSGYNSRINLASLPPGMYILKMDLDDKYTCSGMIFKVN